jgi:hypothetical protein
MMKNLIARKRNTIAFRAISPAALISICLYVFVRILFFEFPMSWLEEFIFFSKVILSGVFFISLCVIGLKLLYFFVLKFKQRKKQSIVKLANTLFLKKNKEYVQYTVCSN